MRGAAGPRANRTHALAVTLASAPEPCANAEKEGREEKDSAEEEFTPLREGGGQVADDDTHTPHAQDMRIEEDEGRLRKRVAEAHILYWRVRRAVGTPSGGHKNGRAHPTLYPRCSPEPPAAIAN